MASFVSSAPIQPCYHANETLVVLNASVKPTIAGGTKLNRKFNSVSSSARKVRVSAQSGALLQQSEVELRERKLAYSFRTQFDSLVNVSVRENPGKYIAAIEVSSNEHVPDELTLNWGIFTSDPSLTLTESPILRNPDGSYSAEIEFIAMLAPLYLAFQLNLLASKSIVKSNHGRESFIVPIGFSSGKPFPLGLSFSSDGSINFAIVAMQATAISLCLYDDISASSPTLELSLDPIVNKTGDIWHASIKPYKFSSYSYKFFENGEHFTVLDPYAKSILPNNRGRILDQDDDESFDWSGDRRPNHPLETLIIYRLNIARFTRDKSSKLPAAVAGKFAGVSEMATHFIRLGVNAVLLEPVFLFDEIKGPYYPHHFFSPSSLYGSSKAMKEMVKKLHSQGIEVLLEVNYTGLDCKSPVTQRLILDSLQHWVTQFHVDGFCFINAAFLANNENALARSVLVEAIAFDPLLAGTKLIADSFDPKTGDRNGAVFPHWKRWAEINHKFCYDVREFVKGGGALSALATRLCGSGDVFFNGRGPAFSLNYVSRNFGLSLVDLVSYNVEPERSWNCGDDGPTKKTAVLERRLKQIRNFIFILFVSMGVPVVNMGDECGQTCGGSVEYSDRGDFDWGLVSGGFGAQTVRFVSFLVGLRKRRSEVFEKREFLGEEKIRWCGSDMSAPKWDDLTCRFLAVVLEESVYVAFNLGETAEKVALPPPGEGMKWRRVVDTALPFPQFFGDDGGDVEDDLFELKAYSCVLFEAFEGKSSLIDGLL